MKLMTFPDGRTALVKRNGSPAKEKLSKAEIQQVKDLLKVGVSRRLISCHLNIKLSCVNGVCARWKQNELPMILQTRSKSADNVPSKMFLH